jgi:hypothetical protein
MLVSCLFHLFLCKGKMKIEFNVKSDSLIIGKVLFNMVFKRLFLTPFYAFKITLSEKYLSFIHFI